MQASVLSPGSLGWKVVGLPVNVRPFPCQNHAHTCSAGTALPVSLRGTSRSRNVRIVRSAQQEDYAETETETETEVKSVPSVLKLAIESRGEEEASTSPRQDGLGDLIQTGTVKEVLEAATKAVTEAPVKSVGQVALYSGMAAFGLLISGALMNSVEHVPFIPEALETVGVVYTILIARYCISSVFSNSKFRCLSI